MLLCAAVCLAAHAPNLFIVAPRYLRALGHDELHIGLIGGSFSAASLLAMPIWARVAERRGARASIITGMAMVAVGCVLFEPARGLAQFMVVRALAGLGWSGVLVGSSLAATQLAPPGRMAQALGTAGVLTLVAMAMGPLVGEALIQFGWPWVFRTAAAAAAAGIVVARLLPRLRPRGLTDAPADASPRGLAWITASPVWEPQIFMPLAAMLLVATGFGAVVFFLADHTHLVGDFGVSPFFNAYVACAVLMRLVAGHLSDRVGRHPVIMPSFFGQAAALAGLAALTARWQLWPLGAIFGVTHGLYYPALQALVVERSPPARRARAVASGNFAFALGMLLSAWGCGAIARPYGYDAVYGVVAAASIGALVILGWDRRSHALPVG